MDQDQTEIVADRIVAREIVIAASDGVGRIRLAVSEDGHASATFHSLAGESKIFLAVTPNGDPAITIFGRGESLRLLAAGGLAITFVDEGDESEEIRSSILSDPETGEVVALDRQGFQELSEIEE